MPLVSRAQAAFLRHNKPKLFKEFAAATPKGKKLPFRATKKQKRDLSRGYR